MVVGGDGRRWRGRDDGRGVMGGGGGEERSRVALFEPTTPDLARRGPRPEDGNIKHQCCLLEMLLWCSWLEHCLIYFSGLGFNSCMLHFFFFTIYVNNNSLINNYCSDELQVDSSVFHAYILLCIWHLESTDSSWFT